MHHDALVWQVPALGLAAQAFLFTIALAPETGRGPRFIAAALAAITAWMSVLLMMRHRAFERSDALWIDAFERRHGFRAQREVEPTATGPKPLRWIIKMHAFDVWSWGLLIFTFAATAVVVLTAVTPQFFATH
jgi:hypothetical protein